MQKPVLYLSHYFKRHRQDYYDRLQAVRDNSDWEGWLEFFLRGIAEVSAEATDTARRILALRETHRAIVTEQLGRAAANGHRVLKQRPIMSLSEVRELTGTTFPAANQLVQKVAQHGILTELTGQRRHRRSSYDAYVQLFAEESGAS